MAQRIFTHHNHRGISAARAEDAQGTPAQSHVSPSILVYGHTIQAGSVDSVVGDGRSSLPLQNRLQEGLHQLQDRPEAQTVVAGEGGDRPGSVDSVVYVGDGRCEPQPSTLNPQPSTLNPQPSTLNPQPSTLICIDLLAQSPQRLKSSQTRRSA